MNYLEKNVWDVDLNYKGENKYSSFFSTEGTFHSYPAKAVPDMVHTLINILKKEYQVKSLLDPFVGSGTVALEAKYSEIEFYGSDLNPLSVLLTRTKVLTVNNTEYTISEIRNFIKKLNIRKKSKVGLTYFDNIEYWFKKESIEELSFLKNEIDLFLKQRTNKYKEQFTLILLTAFSATIRQTSLTRNSEFKLYRMSPNKINEHNVNAIQLFEENVLVISNMMRKMKMDESNISRANIYLNNAKSLNYMKNKKVDLILTSPPYGDSKSTVAYGQFSKLSLQWIGDLMSKYLSIPVENFNCDEDLLGGKRSNIEIDYDILLKKSTTLSELYKEMNKITEIESKVYHQSLECFYELKNRISDNKLENLFEIIKQDRTLEGLIFERLRLSFSRLLKKDGKLDDKKVKKFANLQANEKLNFLKNSKKHKYIRTVRIIERNLLNIEQTIIRKTNSQSKRAQEVMEFFADLYNVVIKTDEVLNVGGIQAWIVGHRTVMGKVNINFEKILSEWFESLGYKNITSLSRNYSFKRLPSRINSTVSRKEEIETMLKEYILIVQKN